jgi:hypothetical protein
LDAFAEIITRPQTKENTFCTSVARIQEPKNEERIGNLKLFIN